MNKPTQKIIDGIQTVIADINRDLEALKTHQASARDIANMTEGYLRDRERLSDALDIIYRLTSKDFQAVNHIRHFRYNV